MPFGMADRWPGRGLAVPKSSIFEALSAMRPVASRLAGLAHMVLNPTGYHPHERPLRPGMTTHRP
jgi:hypothetical protein